MAFNWQTINIPASGGVNTKLDPLLVRFPEMLNILDGVFIRESTISTRNGHTILPTTILGGGSITSGQTLATYTSSPASNVNEELLLFNNGTGYTFLESEQGWLSRGMITPVTLSESNVVANTYSQSNQDADTINGITVVAWSDTRGGVWAKAFDEATGAQLIIDTQLSATGTIARVCACSSGIITILYGTSGGSLIFQTLNTLSSGMPAFTAPQTIETNVATSGPSIDTVAFPSGAAIIAAWEDQSSHTRLAYITTGGLIGTLFTGYPVELTITQSSNASVSVVLDGSNNIWVGMSSSSGFYGAVYSSTFSTTVAPVLIDANVNVVNITGYVSGNTINYYYEISAAATYNHLIQFNTLTSLGVVGTPLSTGLVRSVGLGSKVFLVGSVPYCYLIYSSFLQAMYVLCNMTSQATASNPIAYGQSGSAAGLFANGSVPRIFSPSGSGNYCLITGYREQLESNVVNISNQQTGISGIFLTQALTYTSGTPQVIVSYYLNGLHRLNMTFGNPNQYQTSQLGGDLHLTGGVLSIYDGQGFVEHGFQLFPENITSTPSTSGGNMTASTYQYIFTFSWQDAQGQIHESAPSVPITVIVGGSGSGSVAFSGPTLRFTGKQSPRTAVQINCYRSDTINQPTFYAVGNSTASPIASIVYNSLTSDTWSFTDTTVNASITANQQIYTTGGLLEHGEPPACSLIAQSKNRLFLAGIVNSPNTIWYSNPYVPGQPVNFSPFNTITIPAMDGGSSISPSGPITAIWTMDDFLIIFKENCIYQVQGAGPDATGGTSGPIFSGFSNVELITTDVGCVNPQSIITYTDGVAFQSSKGLYLLPRGVGNTAYFGNKVEAVANYQTVTSANLIPGVNQIRFTFSGNNLNIQQFGFTNLACVYDYYVRNWSLFSNHLAVDGVLWNQQFIFLTPSGQVYVETPGFYQDGNKNIDMLLEFGWLPVAGPTGFQAIKELRFLGTYYAPHTMNLEIAYNYQDNPIEIIQWKPNGVLYNGSPYGQDIYGTTTYGGSANTVNWFRHKPVFHKCAAIKFKLYAQNSAGLGFTVTGIDVTVAAMPRQGYPLGGGNVI